MRNMEKSRKYTEIKKRKVLQAHGNIQKSEKNRKFISEKEQKTAGAQNTPALRRTLCFCWTSPHFWWHFTILAEQREDSCSTDVRRSPKRSASRSWLLASNLQKEWRKERRDSRKSVSNKTFWQAMKNLSLRFTRNMWNPFTSPSVQGGEPALSLSPQSCPRAALVPASSGCSSQQFGPDESDGPGYQGGTLESVRN